MAFVVRSQKNSIFQVTKSDSKLQIPEKDQRIHHKCDNQYAKLIGQKKSHKQNVKSMDSFTPSIPNGHKTFQSLGKSDMKKFVFNISDIRKYKRTYKLNSAQQNQLKDAKEFYDLPGSLQQKSMVKYIKKTLEKQNKNNNKTPGPGTYNPKNYSSVQTPVFIKNSQSKLETRADTIQNQLETKDQKFFAVKYNCMSSSVFKKPPNLLKKSNKFLFNKIFHDKTPSLDHQMFQNLKQQYERFEQKSPGPTYYHSRQSSLNKNAPIFNKAQRFMNQMSDGCPKYYNLSPNKQQNPNQTSCFNSLVQRFEDKKQCLINLQYADYQNSLIKQSKNVKRICFNSKIFRSEQKQSDERPFYSVDNQKMSRLGKFSTNDCQRIAYYINVQGTPSPFQYNVSPSWSNYNGFSIPKSKKTQPQHPNQALNKQNLGLSFYLCSEICFNKKEKKEKTKSPKRRKQFSKKILKFKEEDKENYKIYDTSPEWQIKSFNRNFASNILPANNPIQFRI